MARGRWIGVQGAAVVACACGAAAGGDVELTLEVIAGGIASPTSLTHAPGDAERLFFTERAGRVRVIRNGTLLEQPFLDIADQVNSDPPERAMGGLAFHPEYQANGRFFVTYTDLVGNGVLAGFTVSADPDVADPASQAVLLTLPQPGPTHNVGGITFGPDGYLYVGSGDGGNNTGGVFAQDTETLLGKILRLDVDGAAPYAIPPDNPFLGIDGLDEIWAFGLRNPWRLTFDRLTGDLWIGDVGQGAHEEVDFQPAGAAGAANYGWNCMQAGNCYPGGGCTCGDPGLTAPIYEYTHADGCAVIGGYVYRGCELPQLVGRYVFADHCGGNVRALDPKSGEVSELVGFLPLIHSLGEDLDGELYVLTSASIGKLTFVDCNGNEVPDADDIAGGSSPDCNGNGTPDECETQDCNGNAIPDNCDIASGTSPDANNNGIPDECDGLGDLDEDGVVGVTDLLILLGNWGPCLDGAAACPGDINNDGNVDVTDLLLLLGHWG